MSARVRQKLRFVASRRFCIAALLVFGGTGITFAEEGLLFRWQFDAQHISGRAAVPLAGEVQLEAQTDPRFDLLAPQALVFDEARADRFFPEAKTSLEKLALPHKELTAEAWVRVDKTLEWGGVFGAVQDNGDYERGWLLGYRKSHFFFALASEKTHRITYLTGQQPFEPGHWYHIVGTWDGTVQSLFVDGKLAATSKAQAGSIVYPDEAHFGVGAYWDKDEFHPLTGQIEQVSLWNRPLKPAEIRSRFDERKSRFPGIEAEPPKVVDWPTHLRDIQRTGIAAEKSLKFPLHKQWVYRTRHRPAPAWPPPAEQDFWHKNRHKARVTFDRACPLIAVGDAVYFSSSAADHVSCLDMATGARRWRVFAQAPVRLAPTYENGRVLFGSDDGCVYCVSAADGSEIWRHRLVEDDRQIPGNGRVMSIWPVRSGILVDEGKALFCAGLFPQQGVFQAALDVESGKLLGRGSMSVSTQGYLERRGSQLHVTTGRDPAGAFLSQLSRRGKGIGKEVRSIPQRYPYAFIGDAKSRYGGGKGEVAAFDVSTGKEKWRAEVDGRAYEMAISGRCLLVSTDAGAIYCFGETPGPGNTVTPEKPSGYPWASREQQQQIEAQAERALAFAESTGTKRGWALVLGSGDGALAAEIARRSEFNVVGVERDATLIATARERIEAAGLAGRVSFHTADSVGKLPFTDYLFNLVVDASSLSGGERWPDDAEIKRVTRPGDGVAILGADKADTFRRYPLKGIGEWTHQYGDAGNTACSKDERVGGRMRLQWFGAPGPRAMMDRHHRTAAPLWAGGRLFIPGNNRVIAADAYNGTPLWDVAIPDSRRAGVYRDCSYMAATGQAVFVAAAAKCEHLDAASGKTLHSFAMPGSTPDDNDEWGYVAAVDGMLIGSRQRLGASRHDHSLDQINEGTYYDSRPLVCSRDLFALDPESGETIWQYRPRSGIVVNSTIAISGGRVCFIESDLTKPAESTGRHRAAELFEKPAKLTVLNRKTGEQISQKVVDLSRIEHAIYLVATQERLVLVGSYNKRVGDQPKVRFDIAVFDANSSSPLWKKTQNQGSKAGGSHGEQDFHPVVVNGKLYCEPFGYDLHTGEPLKNWGWNPAHRRGCGTIAASASTFFFRHSNPTMFDLTKNAYSKVTTSTRPGCWINMIPAGGLLLVPEGSSGCSCNYAIQSSMAFLPVPETP